jgi:hypothetical protein
MYENKTAKCVDDAVAGMRGDADRLREVEAAILGVNGVPDSEAG